MTPFEDAVVVVEASGWGTRLQKVLGRSFLC